MPAGGWALAASALGDCLGIKEFRVDAGRRHVGPATAGGWGLVGGRGAPLLPCHGGFAV